MNPFVEIEFVAEQTPLATLAEKAKAKGRHVCAVIQGFSTWAEAAKLNTEVRLIGAVFYSVSSSGLYGFAFADLGPVFSYQYTLKDGTTPDGVM